MLDNTLDTSARQSSRTGHIEAGERPSPAHAKGVAERAASERILAESVAQALIATGYSALRDIEIEICNGIAVLWGCVPTYHQKQMAQAVAQKVDGVRGIANGVEVFCCR
ncbi:MAG: BON domain-containing protein [Deltaproteobacteria bacterium]